MTEADTLERLARIAGEIVGRHRHKFGDCAEVTRLAMAVDDVVMRLRRSREQQRQTLLAEQAVRAIFTITVEELHSDSRLGRVTEARFAVWSLLRRHTRLSYEAIALAYRRHHTTILHGVRRIEALMRTDPQLNRMVEAAERLLITQINQGGQAA